MKVSLNWIQDYIEEKLPAAEKVADALAMHSFEIEGIEKLDDDTVIDVKILPDRAHYAQSHYGVATEIATVMNLKLRSRAKLGSYPLSEKLSVSIQDPKLCRRYCGAFIKGVKVGPSPAWLKERLESIGQRSINNIVDATNYVMLSIGQPLHAFDAKKLAQSGGHFEIAAKRLGQDECLIALDDKSYDLKKETLVIADGISDKTLAIAGIKGGAVAAVKESTADLILESANFDPVTVRKTGRSLGLITDAQKRFENELTPELALQGLSDLIALIQKVAGGDVEGWVDVYPKPVQPFKLGVSLREINETLGTKLSAKEIEAIITRFGFEHGCVMPHENVVRLAGGLVGKAYVWGASVLYDAPEKFDCSSFTSYLYKESGVQIPRIAADQYIWGKKISKNELMPGDLIFSRTKRQDNKIHTETVDFMPGTPVPDGVSHVGIFAGNDEVIHAASSQGVVTEKLSDSISFKEIVGYRRMAVLNEKRWWVSAPAERLDIRIKEDLIEEIGRVYGYIHIESREPKKIAPPVINKSFAYTQKIKSILIELGFSEIYTYSFTDNGEIEVANPLASDKGFLRQALTPGMTKSLEFNLRNADLLQLDQIKLFEIGKVFKKDKEYNALCIGVANVKGFKNKNLEKDEQTINGEIRWTRETLWEKIGANVQTLCTIDDMGGIMVIKGKAIGTINNVDGVMEINLDALIAAMPEVGTGTGGTGSFGENEALIGRFSEKEPGPDVTVVKFRPISPYPFIVRDIAVFVPGEQGKENEVLDIIKKEGGELMLNYRLFDVFTKNNPSTSSGQGDGEVKTSYAYRLVFQSQDRTLTDEEINPIMERITAKMNANKDWQVR
jgi:phenylalanyl-tRNA synthetase beta subunit